MDTVTLINLFRVSTENETKFLQSWHQTAEQMKKQPGFIDATLHRHLEPHGKFQFINVAHWKSVEAFRKAQANVTIFETQLGIEANPGLYSIETIY